MRVTCGAWSSPPKNFQLIYVPGPPGPFAVPLPSGCCLLPLSSLRFSCLRTLITRGVPIRRSMAQAKRTSPLHLWQARLAASLGQPPLVCWSRGKWHHAQFSQTITMCIYFLPHIILGHLSAISFLRVLVQHTISVPHV